LLLFEIFRLVKLVNFKATVTTATHTNTNSNTNYYNYNYCKDNIEVNFNY